MPVNMRPPGAAGPMYAPERDLAYIAPTLLRAAIVSLDPPNILPSLRAYMDQHGVTDADLAKAINAIAEAQTLFVGTLDVRSPYDALQAAGFLDLSGAIQGVVLAAFGRVLLGAWFQAVRDTTHIEDAPANQEDISRYYYAALSAAANLRQEAVPAAPEDPRLAAAVLAEQLRHLRNYHSEVLHKLKAERARNGSLAKERNECLAELLSLKRRPLYRLGSAIKRGWLKLLRRS